MIDAGADIDALAPDDSGGVPGGSALLHAGVFGNTEVVNVLAVAGARVRSVVEAAAVGNIDGWLAAETPLEERVRAMTMAAGHDRVEVIEQLLAAGTPVDAVEANPRPRSGLGRRVCDRDHLPRREGCAPAAVPLACSSTQRGGGLASPESITGPGAG